MNKKTQLNNLKNFQKNELKKSELMFSTIKKKAGKYNMIHNSKVANMYKPAPIKIEGLARIPRKEFLIKT